MAVLQRSKNQIFGLNTDLATLQANINAEASLRAQADSVNRDVFNDGLETLTNAVVNLNNDTVKKAGNLFDLPNKIAARSNLQVNSIDEVDAKIAVAKLALGTRYIVENISARNALVDLDLADTVFVTNAADNGWAIYQPGAVDETGAGSSWITLNDEATFINANSASAIKAAYESNPDTNAFTDAEKDKLALISATTAIDLDKVIQSDELNTDPTLASATDTQIPSAAAVKAFVQAASNSGGVVFKTESLVVIADKITLDFKPKDGMILNFATVRHVDANGVAYDIPVVNDVSDLTGKTFILSPDTTGQFDTKSVVVQYPHTL